jgi:hypothetical protein
VLSATGKSLRSGGEISSSLTDGVLYGTSSVDIPTAYELANGDGDQMRDGLMARIHLAPAERDVRVAEEKVENPTTSVFIPDREKSIFYVPKV